MLASCNCQVHTDLLVANNTMGWFTRCRFNSPSQRGNAANPLLPSGLGSLLHHLLQHPPQPCPGLSRRHALPRTPASNVHNAAPDPLQADGRCRHPTAVRRAPAKPDGGRRPAPRPADPPTRGRRPRPAPPQAAPAYDVE